MGPRPAPDLSLRRRGTGAARGVAAAVAGVLAACFFAPAPASAATVTTPSQGTQSAADFIDSVGVNVHWNYPDTPYGYDYERVKSLLVASGIRHVRGEATRAADLAASGIQTTVLVDLAMDGRGDPREQALALRSLAVSGAVVAVEGPNEPDVFWVAQNRTYEGQPFPQGVVRWQEDLYRTVKGDTDLRELTVIGPGLGETYWGGGYPFSPGAMATTVDWGNLHPYPSGNSFTPPIAYAGLAKYYWHSDFPSVALDRYPINLTTYRQAYGSRPMASTETGYSTWSLGQSERTQGRYLPRLFLENYRLGIERSYSYELVDEFADPARSNREAHFGLLRHDLAPKPAYRAMQSLLGALGTGEPSTPTAVTDLDYRLTVSPPPGYDAAQLHHVVLQRADGSHVVALWHEVSGNDLSGLEARPPQPIREVAQPAMDVALTLPGAPEGVTVQTIDDGGVLRDAATRRQDAAIAFQVPDRVTLVSIPSGDQDPVVQGLRRVGGTDRVATALAVANDRFDAPAAGAVLATSGDFADALAGGPLAAAITGPLLLTDRRSLDSRVVRYLRERVQAGGTIYLLGGEQALGSAVERAVEALGLRVVRVAGADRYESALAIADRLASLGHGTCDVLLATGRNFADGASAAGASSPSRPLLFTDGAAVPRSTLDHLQACVSRSGTVEATAVGGPAAAAVTTLEESFGRLEARSVVGSDRYETSALLADEALQGTDEDRAVLTTGADFPDALVGGTYGSPVLLTPRAEVAPPVAGLLQRRRSSIDEVLVVGGPAAVSPAAAARAATSAL